MKNTVPTDFTVPLVSYVKLAAQRDELRAEVARLTEDKERLDWLETKTSVTWSDGTPAYFASPNFAPVPTTLRASIDAARAQKSKKMS